VDFLCVEDKVVERRLLRAALAWFASRAADYALCRVLRQEGIFQVLEGLGFREDPAHAPIPVVYRVFSGAIDEAYLKDPRHWHLTFGDSDGV
jgi:hypothetical protein